ncbi:MAG TPA: TadE family protein [Candidatus Limnocylindrales bacterium]|nr:TadE family protein [Candidatus Limnocylindrales bacterium]
MIRRRRSARGQSLVEFALVLPVFLFMLFGLVDVSRFVYLNSTLSQAAREGARLGSVEASYRGSTDPACGKAGGPVCPANDAALLSHITSAANRMMSPFGAVGAAHMACVQAPPAGTPPTGAWTGSSCSFHAPGSVISVRVTASFTPITPIISNFFGTRTLAGAATMTIN